VPRWVYVAGGVGAVLQIIGFSLLGRAVIPAFKQRYQTGPSTVRVLLFIASVALVLKLLLQFLSAWPALAEFAYRSRDLIIAYLHEYLIGSVTLALLALAMAKGCIAMYRHIVRVGLWVFLAGFFLTEAALLLRGVWPVVHPVLIQYALVLGASLLTCALFCLVVGTIDGRKIVERSR
jgi:hypothetical protein